MLRALRQEPDCRPPYKGCGRASLSDFARLLCIVAAVGPALSLGGCSYQLGSAWEKSRQQDADITGSIKPSALNAQAELIPDRSLPPQADLAHARAAVAEVLARGGKDASQPWENPETGARGAVTPVASVYASNGQTCRDFLLSYVKGGAETWLQGDACRSDGSDWQVRTLRAWKKS